MGRYQSGLPRRFQRHRGTNHRPTRVRRTQDEAWRSQRIHLPLQPTVAYRGLQPYRQRSHQYVLQRSTPPTPEGGHPSQIKTTCHPERLAGRTQRETACLVGRPAGHRWRNVQPETTTIQTLSNPLRSRRKKPTTDSRIRRRKPDQARPQCNGRRRPKTRRTQPIHSMECKQRTNERYPQAQNGCLQSQTRWKTHLHQTPKGCSPRPWRLLPLWQPRTHLFRLQEIPTAKKPVRSNRSF